MTVQDYVAWVAQQASPPAPNEALTATDVSIRLSRVAAAWQRATHQEDVVFGLTIPAELQRSTEARLLARQQITSALAGWREWLVREHGAAGLSFFQTIEREFGFGMGSVPPRQEKLALPADLRAFLEQGIPPLPPDLLPLPAGAPSQLSFVGETDVERRPAAFAPGACEGPEIRHATIFEEELALRRCGLLVLKSQRGSFERPAADLVADATHVVRLAGLLRRTWLASAASSRFAPFLFEPTGPRSENVAEALCRTLRVVAAKTCTLPFSVDELRQVFLNGLDHVIEGAAPGALLRPSPEELERLAAIAREALVPLGEMTEVTLGAAANGRPDFFRVPVFFVGWTPGRRLGGLMATFVD